MTKGSFTEMQKILFIDFFFNSSFDLRKLGKCLFEQVGVKAPGKPNKITLPLFKISLVFIYLCSFPNIINLASGSFSPFFIFISLNY